jgi:hypothetical protein
VYQRPRSLTNDEAALTDATHKAPDGKPVNALGYPRPYGVLGDCCLPAPAVMEFDANGKLLHLRPADPASVERGRLFGPQGTASSSIWLWCIGNGGGGSPTRLRGPRRL